MNQISPLAFVHPEAKLGDNNIIGPFCYIDKNTEIGDNNNFQNSVTINYGARIGNNNEIFPESKHQYETARLEIQGRRHHVYHWRQQFHSRECNDFTRNCIQRHHKGWQQQPADGKYAHRP